MNPLTLITISFIISYFLNFHICLYSQNVLTFISTKIPETFYFHISVSISIYFEFPYHDPQEQLKKEFRILDKDFSTSSLQIYIKKIYVTASSKRKTPPLLQDIQRLETNSKVSFVILKSRTRNLFCNLYKKKKQIFITQNFKLNYVFS